VVVAAVREDENASLLRQSGVTVVVTSARSVGRLLGVSTLSPSTGAVLDDLLTAGHGLDVIDRSVTHVEVGRSPATTATTSSPWSAAAGPCIAIHRSSQA
jgi:voltage-gated potassium channel